MLAKTEAIVLHSLKYGDKKMIVDMFTREYGRLSFVSALPRSGRSRIKKQYFQPLTLLRVEADVRPTQSLQQLRDASLLSPCPSLFAHPEKLSIALFLAEFLYHALRGEQQNVLLFDYVHTSLQWLDGCQARFANFHLVFLMRLSRFLGFYPNTEGNVQGTFFDLRESRFCPHPPLHRDFLQPSEAQHISLMMRMDYPTMHLFRLTQADRRRLLQVLMTYYRLHLPAFPELHSLSVLYQLYD